MDGWLVLSDKSGLFDQDYLFYFLGSAAAYKQFDNLAAGSTVRNLNTELVKRVSVPVPPLPEQRRIVTLLDDAFAGLATASANAEQNLRNARKLFESYLYSVFTRRPGEWVEKSLREVSVEFGRGKSKHRPRNDPALYGGKYPFIQTGDIRNAGGRITEYTQTYNERGLAQSKLWPKGTICITIAANIAETGILCFDACFPDSIIGIVVDPALTNNKFVEYLLRFFRGVLQAQGKGSAQDNNLGTFENRKFPFPLVKLQNELAAGLDMMATEVGRLESSYEARLQHISELKQSILQKAFSGELTSPPSQAIKEAAE
jgi:type I restriction enzyme, S subunit